jgi:hypothetical protein
MNGGEDLSHEESFQVAKLDLNAGILFLDHK